MRIALIALRLACWLFIAYLPVAMSGSAHDLRSLIGCPAQGECYQKGWWIAHELRLWSVGSALVIWPLVVGQLIGIAKALKQP